MSLLQRLLGTPFVYNVVRPLAVGGLDMSPFYRSAGTGPDSVVLDLGCGTGDALRYLQSFERYVGVDTDPIAIDYAKKRFQKRERVRFECRHCEEKDVAELQPTEVLLGGVLHHVPDDVARDLLRLVAGSPRLRRVVALDIVYLPGERVSNFLASLDRGRYCRRPDEYVTLAKEAGFTVADSTIQRSHPRTGIAKYWVMALTPTGAKRRETADAGA